jgi:proline dehydrogenase
MLHALPKAAFAMLASSETLKRLADRSGKGRPGGPARRFLAGQTGDDVVRAAAAAESAGRRVTFDRLAPSPPAAACAMDATRSYVEFIQASAAAGSDRHLAVKLTQIGLLVDRATAFDNLRRLLDAAEAGGMLVRIDVASADVAAVSLDTVETLWHIGYRNLGIGLPASLRRTSADVDRMNAVGISVRLSVGGGRQSREVAYPDAPSIASSYRALTERLLVAGHQPAFATHEPALIAHARSLAAAHDIPRDRYEFELWLGVRPDLQADLTNTGYRVRIDLPFGQEWFPYLMYRLGERPSTLFTRR